MTFLNSPYPFHCITFSELDRHDEISFIDSSNDELSSLRHLKIDEYYTRTGREENLNERGPDLGGQLLLVPGNDDECFRYTRARWRYGGYDRRSARYNPTSGPTWEVNNSVNPESDSNGQGGILRSVWGHCPGSVWGPDASCREAEKGSRWGEEDLHRPLHQLHRSPHGQTTVQSDSCVQVSGDFWE